MEIRPTFPNSLLKRSSEDSANGEATVETVEHLLAALTRRDNAVVGSTIATAIMDGSSASRPI